MGEFEATVGAGVRNGLTRRSVFDVQRAPGHHRQVFLEELLRQPTHARLGHGPARRVAHTPGHRHPRGEAHGPQHQVGVARVVAVDVQAGVALCEHLEIEAAGEDPRITRRLELARLVRDREHDPSGPVRRLHPSAFDGLAVFGHDPAEHLRHLGGFRLGVRRERWFFRRRSVGRFDDGELGFFPAARRSALRGRDGRAPLRRRANLGRSRRNRRRVGSIRAVRAEPQREQQPEGGQGKSRCERPHALTLRFGSS